MKAYDQPLVDEDNNNQSYQKTKIYEETDFQQPALFKIRVNFLRNSIMTYYIQLSASILLGLISVNGEVSKFLESNRSVFWASVLAYVIVLLPIIFFSKTAKKFPYNYILLLVFVFSQGIIVAYAMNYFTWQTILIVIALAQSVILSLFVYSLFLKGTLVLPVCFLILTAICTLGLLIFSLVFSGLFTRTLYSTIGVFIFGLFFIFESKLLIGKCRKEYNENDYVIAALSINLDLVQLFTIPLSTLRDSFDYDL